MRCPALVGRGDELREVDAVVAAAQAGSGRALLLTGEPGVGKSRILAEAVDAASGRGLYGVAGRAAVESTDVPFFALSEALTVAVRDRPAPNDGALAPFVPVLAQLIPSWRRVGWRAPNETPVVLGEAVLMLLRELGGGGGVMLCMDDVHWADTATIGVLDYLVRHCCEVSLSVTLTSRDGEPHHDRVVAQLARAGAVVRTMGRLDAADVEAMIAACGADASEPRAAEIVRVSDGLPLLVEDLLDGPGEHRASRFADTVRQRLAQLGDASRQALATLAVIGEAIDTEVAVRVVPAGSQSVDECVSFGLLTHDGSMLRFRHALTREVVLAEPASVDRAAIALAAAQALLVSSGTNLSLDLHAATLLCDAGRIDNALALLGEAATRAQLGGDIRAAESALERAWAIARRERAAGAPAFGRRLALAHLHTGRAEQARLVAWQSLAMVEGIDPSSSAALKVLVARAQIAVAAWDDALEQLRSAMSDSSSLPAGLVAEIALLEAECALGADREGQRAAVGHLAERAVALAHSTGGGDLEAEALQLAGRVARIHDLSAAASRFERALTVLSTDVQPYLRVQILNELGTVEMLRDARPDRLERALAEAQRCGAVGLAVSAALNVASAYVMTGRHVEGLELAQATAATAARLGLVPLQAACVLMDGVARAFRGEADADHLLSQAESLAPDDADLHVGAWAIGRGLGALVLEDRDRARRALDRAAEQAPREHARILDAASGPRMLLRALGGEADLDEAEALLAADQTGARWHRLWGSGAVSAAAARSGHTDRAVNALSEALSAGDRYPLFGALVRRLVAETAIEYRFIDPVPLLREAEAAFVGLGLPRPAEACRGMLRAVGAAAPRRRRGDEQVATDLARAGVTAREAEVLALLAERRTNREIAAQLFLSPKTVEKHVAALVTKLGLASRIELGEFERARSK